MPTPHTNRPALPIGHMDAPRPNVERRPARVVSFIDRERNGGRDWRHQAECRNEDPELFHPIGATGPALLQIEDAKAVCRRCPVIESCLEFALRAGIDQGVYGGMSEDERRALKRRAARARQRAA